MTNRLVTRTLRRAAVALGVSALAVAGAATVTATVAAADLPPQASEVAVVHAPKRYPTVQGKAASRGAAGAQAQAASLLQYNGGNDGIGVTSGPPKVYLVFWGSQWGTATTGGDGTVSFANDTSGMAPRVQALLRGLGTSGELWSGVMTQYCDGSLVSAGATTCASNAAHVGYPTGGPLAGVWYDNAAAQPSTASNSQLASEAVNAATHFGNTTKAANRYAQYVVVSPSGLHPGGFNAPLQWCAWHSWTTGFASGVGYDVAYTNLPYLTDVGTSCGSNFVNSGGGGTLDGVTIVEGHEYAETLTDQNPSGGWVDSGGAEDGDKCAWISSGTGAAANVAFGTGSYPMQSTWSNDGAVCSMSHAVVTGTPANTVSVTNPGNQSTPINGPASLSISAGDSDNTQTLTYGATGLPAGLTIDSASGVISGTVTTGGTTTVTVKATDTTGAFGTASFTWTVVVPCTSGQKLGNGNFDTGVASPWAISASRILNNSTVSGKEPPRSPFYDAFLGGLGTSHTDTLSQSVTIPAGCTTYSLSFWLHVDTAESPTKAADRMTVTLGGTTLATYSNLNGATGWSQKTFNVSSFAGKTITLTFTATENPKRQTSFVIDDGSLLVA
jgi:serine protease